MTIFSTSRAKLPLAFAVLLTAAALLVPSGKRPPDVRAESAPVAALSQQH